MLMPLLKTTCQMAVLVVLLLAIAPAVHAQDITNFVLDEVVFKDINGETGHIDALRVIVMPIGPI